MPARSSTRGRRREDTASLEDPTVSLRVGWIWQDGLAVTEPDKLRYQEFPTIPFANLSNKNYPPWYLKLEDEQVGHIAAAWDDGRLSLNQSNLASYWPADFMTNGKIRKDRKNFGRAYTTSRNAPAVGVTMLNGASLNGVSDDSDEVVTLDGSPTVRKRRTFLSSGKYMINDPETPENLEKRLATDTSLTEGVSDSALREELQKRDGRIAELQAEVNQLKTERQEHKPKLAASREFIEDLKAQRDQLETQRLAQLFGEPH